MQLHFLRFRQLNFLPCCCCSHLIDHYYLCRYSQLKNHFGCHCCPLNHAVQLYHQYIPKFYHCRHHLDLAGLYHYKQLQLLLFPYLHGSSRDYLSNRKEKIREKRKRELERRGERRERRRWREREIFIVSIIFSWYPHHLVKWQSKRGKIFSKSYVLWVVRIN